MNIEINTYNGIPVAQIASDGIAIPDLEAALDLIGNCGYLGASHIFLNETRLHLTFSILKQVLPAKYFKSSLLII